MLAQWCPGSSVCSLQSFKFGFYYNLTMQGWAHHVHILWGQHKDTNLFFSPMKIISVSSFPEEVTNIVCISSNSRGLVLFIINSLFLNCPPNRKQQKCLSAPGTFRSAIGNQVPQQRMTLNRNCQKQVSKPCRQFLLSRASTFQNGGYSSMLSYLQSLFPYSLPKEFFHSLSTNCKYFMIFDFI